MATEKTLQTRIQLKYDSWNNWNKTAAKSLVLKQGELATVYVPASTSSGETTSEPAFLLKVGDGTTAFENLPWVQAKAADVYEWAKAANKPTYSASEISGLDAYISGQVKDTNTKYQIVQKSTDLHKITLQKQELGETGWTDVDTITIPDNDTTYTLTSGDNNGTVKFNNAEVAVTGLKSAAYQESSAFDSAGAASAVLGKSTDSAGAATVYGANKAAANAQATANAAMPKTGGTFTGNVSVPAPTADAHAARKVDVSNAQTAAATDATTKANQALADAKAYTDTKTAGLTGAMHFVGTSTTDPTLTAGPTIDGKPYSGKSGDVVLWGKKEFVYNGTAWTLLGDEGSYALKTTTVNGHSLGNNITLTATDVGADAAGTASGLVNALNLTKVGGGTGEYIASITQTKGQVSATKGTLPTALKNPHALKAGSKSYDGSSDVTITAADLGAITDISGKQDKLSFDGTYNASSNKVATVSSITSRIAALDVTDSPVAKNFVTAVSETDGKISVQRAPVADIALSGSVNDLVQPANVILVFDCGTSSTVI